MKSKQLQEKLKNLPKGPGVYFHKDAGDEIIYIGKAARLNNRVRHYFQNSRYRDTKTDALVADIVDIEWTETETELDALFLEAELIRRYQPKYNILLRDDKSLSYVRIDYKSDHPTVTLTRRPLDDDAKYFGPFASSYTVKRALKLLRKAFPYSTHTTTVPKRACLHVHIGLCPGLEVNATSLKEYRENLKQLMRYLRGERTALMQQLERDMKTASAEQQFEQAAKLRNQLQTLQRLGHEIVFSDKESLDISKDKGLVELADLLSLDKLPVRIEGYDVSHMQGTDTVASMVVFSRGIPEKAAYRKFKLRLPGNDDFLHMHEVIKRRFSASNQKKWGKPSLCIIDGGKGQLTAALRARDEVGLSLPMIGLAKRYEEIVVHNEKSGVTVVAGDAAQVEVEETFTVITLPTRSHLIKLLQRIRDESHRFAVSYHTVLKRQRTTASLLDDIPGVGLATKKKLLRHFGSMRQVGFASEEDIAAIIGSKKAKLVHSQLAADKPPQTTV